MISLNNYKKVLFLDKYEKDFCKRKKVNLNPTGNPLIIQCVNDLFYLKLFSMVIEQEKHKTSKIYGIITTVNNIRLIEIILVLPIILKFLLNFLNRRKLKKLYSSIGVTIFVDHSSQSFPQIVLNFFTAISIFFKIKSKKQLIDFSYKDILCGDLIYDTVVRFSKTKPTLNLRSFPTLLNLFKAINQIEFFKSFFKNINYSKAFFSQAVYIYHGIPARVLALNSKGEVFCSGNFTQMFKLLNSNHFFMMENFHEYKTRLNEINPNEKLLSEGLRKFEKRFEGVDDTGFIKLMKSNPYVDYNKIIKKNINFDGVLFLHDFYDAHKLYGKVLFNDFYEWAIFTLDLISKNNLNIAIKPHPYQIPESLRAQKKIQSYYKNLIWLDPLVSNTTLINSGLKFGITQHGTIISELAYFGINCIYCSENPVTPFNIGTFAKSKKEYKSLILEAKNLKINKKIRNEIGEYYFSHFLNNKSDYILKNKNIDGINIKNINRFYMKSKELL